MYINHCGHSRHYRSLGDSVSDDHANWEPSQSGASVIDAFFQSLERLPEEQPPEDASIDEQIATDDVGDAPEPSLPEHDHRSETDVEPEDAAEHDSGTSPAPAEPSGQEADGGTTDESDITPQPSGDSGEQPSTGERITEEDNRESEPRSTFSHSSSRFGRTPF